MNAIAFSQKNIPTELQRRLAGKRKVADIMHEVDQFYNYGRDSRMGSNVSEEEFEKDPYQQWKRWEYTAVRRLNEQGELADYETLNQLAKSQVDSIYGRQLRQARQVFDRAPAINESSGTHRPDFPGSQVLRSYGGWNFAGPSTPGTIVGDGDINGLGRLDRIAFHPTDPNTLYVCSSSGGIFKTTNHGATWIDIGDGLPGGAASLAVSPANGNIIYVVSGGGDGANGITQWCCAEYNPDFKGVYKSTNGGISWTKMSVLYTGTSRFVGKEIAVSSTNPNYLFVATNKGLYRSINGGSTWAAIDSLIAIHDVAIAPNNDSVVYYTANRKEFFRSIQGGRPGTFTQTNIPYAVNSLTIGQLRLAVRENNGGTQSNLVYVLAGQFDETLPKGFYGGVYLSTDNGANFTPRSNSPNIIGYALDGQDSSTQATYDLTICIKPTDSTRVVTGGVFVWGSTNSGSAFNPISTWREGQGNINSYLHADIHDVAYNPINNRLYACTDGGLFFSSNEGATWSMISSGVPSTHFFFMTLHDADGDGYGDDGMILAGAQDNGIKLRDNSLNWKHINCCDGGGVVIDAPDPTKLYAALNDGLRKFTNSGANVSSLRSKMSYTAQMVADYNNPDTLYYGGAYTIRSYDEFATLDSLPINTLNVLRTCPSNSRKLYYSPSSARKSFYRSDSRGDDSTQLNINPGWISTSNVSDSYVVPTNSNIVYVSFSGYEAGQKIYQSTNSGGSWSNISYNLPNVPFHSLVWGTEGLYAGSDIGVFFLPAGTSVWTPFYTGMPRTFVSDLELTSTGLIYAATFGRGIWVAERYLPCVASLVISDTLSGPHYYEASSYLEITSVARSGAGTEVFTSSNGQIVMKEGFAVTNGSFFQGAIEPCGAGIPSTSRSLPSGTNPYYYVVEYNDRKRRTLNSPAIEYYKRVEGGIELKVNTAGTIQLTSSSSAMANITSLYSNISLTPGIYKLTAEIPDAFDLVVLKDGQRLTEVARN